MPWGNTVLRSRTVGKLLELAWDHTPLPAPKRQVLRRFPDGRLMTLDLRDRTQRVMYCGAYEGPETRIAKDLLTSGSVFVDAGAHVGWFSVLASRLVSPGGEVVAIEPFPRNSRALRRNVALNRLDNVSVHEVALSGRTGTSVVGRQVRSDSGSVTIGAGAVEDLEQVPCMPLDQLVSAPRIDLLKVDIEGLETDVFAASQETLRRTHAVLVEINEGALARNGSTRSALLETLATAGLTEVIGVTRRLETIRSRIAPAYESVLVMRPASRRHKGEKG